MGQRLLQNPFGQALILALVAFAAGLVVNLARPVPMPFDDSRGFATLPPIRLDHALRDLEGGECLFLDARPKEFYDQGHILNAVSLPVNSADAQVRNTVPNPNPYLRIIIYCSDADCDAADTMARRMKRLGYEKLFVLEGGWLAWTQASLPTE